MMTKQALIIFVKNPIEGQVKTRLAKTIGKTAAVAIYKQLLQHTFSITQHLTVDKFVFYGDYVNEADIWPNTIYQKQLQHGQDLGARMQQAFESVLQKGYTSAIIIGSDCYELDQLLLEEAFMALQHKDAVIGPCEDGGYYLLGINAVQPQLFSNIAWSTDAVYNATVSVLHQLAISFTALPTLNDVDDEASLPAALKQLLP